MLNDNLPTNWPTIFPTKNPEIFTVYLCKVRFSPSILMKRKSGLIKSRLLLLPISRASDTCHLDQFFFSYLSLDWEVFSPVILFGYLLQMILSQWRGFFMLSFASTVFFLNLSLSWEIFYWDNKTFKCFKISKVSRPQRNRLDLGNFEKIQKLRRKKKERYLNILRKRYVRVANTNTLVKQIREDNYTPGFCSPACVTIPELWYYPLVKAQDLSSV